MIQLDYQPKISRQDILDGTPVCQLKGEVSSPNWLIKGDNLPVLQTLLKEGRLAGKVDLIYIDPPFGTSRIFCLDQGHIRTVSSRTGAPPAYADRLSGRDYLEFLRRRLILARELLSEVGSIYVHIDCKIGHYVKVIMDEIFGIKNFRNDITRIKCNPKNFPRPACGSIKDMILFYSKTKKTIWNEPREPLAPEDIRRLYKKTDSQGRAYTTVPLHAPGETRSGATGGLFRGLKPPRGRHWRTDPEELEKLDQKGLVEWSRTGNPRLIVYPPPGLTKRRQDIWNFKDQPFPGYPTEKNLDLLKTIVRTSSQEGSLVLDFFCGSGTALAAAHSLGRSWIGIDESEMAVQAARRRIEAFLAGDSENNYSYLEAVY